MGAFLQDLRFTVRQLRRSTGFTAAAVLTLGVGIGAATALFSIVQSVLLRPLPFPESQRIVHLWQVNAAGNEGPVSDPNFADWAARTRSFQAMAQFQTTRATVIGAAEPVRGVAAYVSRDFFGVMDVHPNVGRGFLPEEQVEGGAPAVVVSHDFWLRQLGGTRELGTRRLTLGNDTYTVVGVMPEGFDFPAGAVVWTPRELLPVLPSRTAHNWQVLARLRPDATLAGARQEVGALSRELKALHGDDTSMADAAVGPLHEQMVGRVRTVLVTLLGASAFLLLVAVANVANLLLARAAAREREMAVRAALGATGARLARQNLTESLVLSLAGGFAGVLLAIGGLRLLLAAEPGNLPRTAEISVGPGVLAFAVALSVVAAAALSLATTFRAGRGELRKGLTATQRGHTAGRSGRRAQAGLVAAQVALTAVLLVGAGLLGRTMVGLLAVDLGFRTSGAVTMQLTLAGAEVERAGPIHEAVLERLRAVPGVREAGGINLLPLAGRSWAGTFVVQTHADEVASWDDFGALARNPERTGNAEYRIASEGFFEAMGIPLLAGRPFRASDTEDGPHVALISESLAGARWPGEDPLGRLIQFGNMDGDLRPFTVVGVVGDVRHDAPDAAPQPTVYALGRQRPGRTSDFTYVISGTADRGAVMAAARRAVAEISPETPPHFRSIEEVVAGPLAPRRFALFLLAAFGGTALLLAGIGIYGITSYAVTQRTREIGLRMAVGAPGAAVLAMVVRQGTLLALVGTVAGAAAAVGLSRYLAHMLHGVETTDPATFLAAFAFLLVVAAVASYLPARRAARVDPMIALRSE